jgi:hypothetical protein
MFRMIRGSASDASSPLPYSPYVLGPERDRPTRFMVEARFDGIRYEYGFAFNASRIVEEWLYSWPKQRQRTLFERRAGEEWYFGDTMTGPTQSLAKATRANALFLSTASLLNHDVLTPLYSKLASLVTVLRTDDLDAVLQNTLKSLSSDRRRQSQVTELMRHAEFGISSFQIEEFSYPEEMMEESLKLLQAAVPDSTEEELRDQFFAKRLLPQLEHRGSSGPVAIPFDWESVGTRNFLTLLGPILDALERGGVLVVDELDTSLHARLVSELVRLFQRPEINRNQAQLILSTHDVTVMMNTGDYNVLQRDQIWFVEKDRQGVSTTFPLSRFKPREGEVFSRHYLLGRYGAVPDIDALSFKAVWPLDSEGQ